MTLQLRLLPDIFKETTSLDIHENDGLPKVLCSTCYDRLLEAYNFRKMCTAAALHFHQILSMDVPEEKYTPPENLSDFQFVDTSLNIKTEPDPEIEDYLCDMSDTLSIDDKLPEILKTEPDDDPKKEKIAPPERLDRETWTPIPSPDNSYCLPDRTDSDDSDDDHGECTSFECAICNSSFNRKSNLEMHVRQVHLGLKPCECKICGMQFETSNSLRNHLNTHQVTKQCNASKITAADNAIADESKSQKDIKKKGKEWSCELCSYKTFQKGTLKHHVKVVHKGIRELHCPECKRGFTRASVLKQHMLRHEGVKNYACPVCGVKKVTQTELRRHMMAIHKIEKMFSCEFCSFKSTLSGSLTFLDF
uniref:Uncharacterized protein n=1 Tax=Phlebotomus papatasi TaxID=29031 RepID=A0A1B0DQD2_PHLPP